MSTSKVAFILVFALAMGLLLTPATAQDMVIDLSPGFAVRQSVTETDPSHQYQVASMTDASVFILLTSEDYTNAPAVTLTNDLDNMPIATLKLAVSGMCLRLAPGTQTYTLSVSADHPQGGQPYALLLLEGSADTMKCDDALFGSLSSGTGAGSGTDTATSTTIIGTIGGSSTNRNGGDAGVTPNGLRATTTCFATSPNQSDVNVRANADLDAPIIADINAGTVAPVLGTVSGNAWLLVDTDDTLGLASSGAVALGGDCSQVPSIAIDGDAAIDLGDNIDLGADLNVDSGLIDTNGNLIDLNGVLDLGGNGKGSLLDVSLDSNRDGLIDVDLNGDGILDIDSNGDGLIDVDVNGDGILDLDLNGDGVLDVDLNGDGLVDVDVNGDGLLDIGGSGSSNSSLIDLDANTNNGLSVNATVGGGSGNNGGNLVDVNANVNTNNGLDVNADVNVDDDTAVTVDVDVQGGDNDDGGLCINALGVEIAC